MTRAMSVRAHLIAGGFPPGASAGHYDDDARLELLGLLAEQEAPWSPMTSATSRSGSR